MPSHSSRHSDSRSRRRSKDRHHSRSRSRDEKRSGHHGQHRSTSRDHSRSYNERDRKRDHSHSSRRRDRDYHSHSKHRDLSRSRSDSIQRDEIEFSNSLKQQLVTSKASTVSATDSSQFLLPLKSDSVPKRAFRFDDKGREINEFGEVVETRIIRPTATLSINKKSQQASQINPYLANFVPGKTLSANPKIKNRAILDPRIKTVNREARKKKALNFIKEGTIIRKADEMRTKAARDLISYSALSEKKDDNEPNDGNETPIKDPMALPPPPHYPVPLMEWWDYDFLPAKVAAAVKDGEYDDGDVTFDMLSMENCVTRDVIEHPVLVERNKLPPPKPMPLMLTKKEKKKARRLRRAEREKDKQIRIQAGLLNKPEDKLNFRNFQTLLGTEALRNPTWADQLVRDQIEKRKLAHQLRNEDRKLTPQEAAEKRERKVIGEKSGEMLGCLFRLESLTDKKQRFKVSVNASQYHLVGRCLIVPSARCVMLYVEGTKKAIRHYKKLLLDRISWNERVDINPLVNDDTKPNSCILLWEGNVKQCRFHEFLMKDCDNDLEARREMEEKSLIHHWDSVINYISPMDRI